MKKILSFLIPSLLVSGIASAEVSAETAFVFNTFLFIFGGILVMFMALGFAMLEAGFVRKKNTSAILLKNIALYYKDLVKNDNLFLGNKNGKEIIIEFFDYNCGYCKRSFPEIMELVSENKDIKIILKELPVLGESSILASKASIASQKQDKYFEFHQELINFSGLISLIDIKKISDFN